VYLGDLTFIGDGNPDKVDNLINFYKFQSLHKVIQQLQLYQQHPFNFTAIPQIRSWLQEQTVMTEEEMYNISLQIEPRNADASQIL
jgi:hypothetical protein